MKTKWFEWQTLTDSHAVPGYRAFLSLLRKQGIRYRTKKFQHGTVFILVPGPLWKAATGLLAIFTAPKVTA